MTAEEVAQATLAAVEARRLHLLLGDEAADRARTRMDRLAADFA